MSTIHSTIMIRYGTQIKIDWIVESSYGIGHVITYVELIQWKSYVILNLFAWFHRSVEIKFKSATQRKRIQSLEYDNSMDL